MSKPATETLCVCGTAGAFSAERANVRSHEAVAGADVTASAGHCPQRELCSQLDRLR
jgi:hypothetical protein